MSSLRAKMPFAVISVWAGLILVALGLSLGCGGEKKSTSSGNSKNYIRFENRAGVGWNTRVHVTIEACHQDFWMEPGESRVVECIPDDGSAEFDLFIEWLNPDLAPWSGTISGGKTVIIRNILSTFYVDIED